MGNGELNKFSIIKRICVYACDYFGFFAVNRTIKCMPEFRSATVSCRSTSVPRIFISASKTFTIRTCKLATESQSKCCQWNWVEPREVKDNSYKPSKKLNVKKRKAIFLSSLLTPGAVLTQRNGNFRTNTSLWGVAFTTECFSNPI